MANTGGLIGLMRSLAADDWITPLMDEYFVKRSVEDWWSPSCFLHPSGAVDPCQRSIQLGLLGHKSPVEARLGRIFDTGKSMHVRWTAYFAEQGMLRAWDIKLTLRDPLMVSGTADLILRRPVATRNELLLGDLKSISSGGFKRLPPPRDPRTNLYALAKQHAKYIGQLLTYLRACPIKMDGFLLFEDKDTQEYKVYLIAYEEAVWRTLLSNAEVAQGACIEKRLIAPPFLKGHPHCRTCWHRDPCFRLQDGDAALAQDIKRRLGRAKR